MSDTIETIIMPSAIQGYSTLDVAKRALAVNLPLAVCVVGVVAGTIAIASYQTASANRRKFLAVLAKADAVPTKLFMELLDAKDPATLAHFKLGEADLDPAIGLALRTALVHFA